MWMWLTIAAVALVVAVIIVIFLLFRIRAISRAEFAFGVPGFSGKLKLQSAEREISKEDFNAVNLNDFYADSNIGFVIHKPFSNEWEIQKTTVPELQNWRGVSEEVRAQLEDVRKFECLVIRRGGAQTIKYTNQTLINDMQIELNKIKRILPKGEETSCDQVIIVTYKKSLIKETSELLVFFLHHVDYVKHLGPKRLFVNPENTVFLLDCSATFKNIEYNGKLGDHVVNNVILCQENDEYFIDVFINYVQSDDKPPKVWDDLRNYLVSFRVLVK